MYNFSQILEDIAGKTPNKEAYLFGNRSWTFDEVNKASNRVANYLIIQGISKGDKVALSCINTPLFTSIYYGILKSGAVVVILGNLLRKEEIELQLKDSSAKVYFSYDDDHLIAESNLAFAETDTCDSILEIPNNNQDQKIFLSDYSDEFRIIPKKIDDLALIMYTSGSTGKPKSVLLSHENLWVSTRVSLHTFNYTPSDISLAVLPFSHSFAHTVLMNSGIMNGNTVLLQNGFVPEKVLDTIVNNEVSIFFGVPTMYQGLLSIIATEKAFPSLRMCVCGGAVLSEEVAERFNEKTNIMISEVYGMTETIGCIAFNSNTPTWKKDSIGKAVLEMEVEILNKQGQVVPRGELGELSCKGKSVMLAYGVKEKDEVVGLRDGWLRTGDLAMMNEEGFLFIEGRIKDMINRGGRNVFPKEIEEVLLTHDKVLYAAVVPVANEMYGEEIKAVVVTSEEVGEEAIRQYCKDRLAAYKYPRIIEFRKELPMTSAGKILKSEL